MAYFVAKELNMRPYSVLTEWTCEELLVAYGHYANQHSNERYSMLSPKERRLHKDEDGKADPLSWLDRWSVLFVTPEQMSELAKDVDGREGQDELSRAAEIFFSWQKS